MFKHCVAGEEAAGDRYPANGDLYVRLARVCNLEPLQEGCFRKRRREPCGHQKYIGFAFGTEQMFPTKDASLDFPGKQLQSVFPCAPLSVYACGPSKVP